MSVEVARFCKCSFAFKIGALNPGYTEAVTTACDAEHIEYKAGRARFILKCNGRSVFLEVDEDELMARIEVSGASSVTEAEGLAYKLARLLDASHILL